MGAGIDVGDREAVDEDLIAFLRDADLVGVDHRRVVLAGDRDRDIGRRLLALVVIERDGRDNFRGLVLAEEIERPVGDRIAPGDCAVVLAGLLRSVNASCSAAISSGVSDAVRSVGSAPSEVTDLAGDLCRRQVGPIDIGEVDRAGRGGRVLEGGEVAGRVHLLRDARGQDFAASVKAGASSAAWSVISVWPVPSSLPAKWALL